ncbi:MAG: hypothetical protein AABX13_01750 [Nanoarchaeota archaeon]
MNHSEQRPDELISLENIILYDKGKPVRTYKKIMLDGEAIRDTSGEYACTTPERFILYLKDRKEKLISLPRKLNLNCHYYPLNLLRGGAYWARVE